MPGQYPYHQSGDDTRGRVQRRADRHQQQDARGQYPRPRNNQFAQPKPRMPQRPGPAPEQTVSRQEPQPETPPRDVFTDGGAQYEQPRKPYVPGYMQPSVLQSAPVQPEEFDMPVQQDEYIRRQNPYVVVSEKNNRKPAMKRRTLLILLIVAALLLTGTGISGLIFTGQTEAVLAARAAAQQTIEQKHPFGYRELIEREAYANNLHPAFVAAIVLNESSFNPGAESYRGARGLMQMMPDTAQWVFGRIGGATEYSFELMYNADMNVTYGCWYLSYLSDKFGGDPVLVAAAFHSGQTNVQNWLSNPAYSTDQATITLENLPDGNTKEYVEKVIRAFAVYRRLYYEEVTL